MKPLHAEKPAAAALSLYVETYGCQMNEYDSGLVCSILGEEGFDSVPTPEQAGVILLNTCAIREKAHEKVFNRLSALAHLKRRNPGTVIGVLGCMAQNLGDDLFAMGLPVDFMLGPDNYRELPRVIQNIRSGAEAGISITQLSRSETYADLSQRVVSGCLAFVTIMRGCDNFCSFCVVPYTRGRERSRSVESIVSEVNDLVESAGVKEVTLLGQNVNSFRFEGLYFVDLIRSILRETSIERIRFTSPHPHDFPEELMELMAAEPRFCSHVHLPLQSGSSAVLERMRRDYTREDYLRLLRTMRNMVPDLGVSTDIIVGFCGESEAEFEETLSLVEEARYDMAFMFRYSERELTYARKNLPDDVAEPVKLQRLERLIEVQTRISQAKNADLVGKSYAVLVEGRSRRSALELMSRTASNKVVIFPVPEGESPEACMGRTFEVVITGSSAATLRGELRQPVGAARD